MSLASIFRVSLVHDFTHHNFFIKKKNFLQILLFHLQNLCHQLQFIFLNNYAWLLMILLIRLIVKLNVSHLQNCLQEEPNLILLFFLKFNRLHCIVYVVEILCIIDSLSHKTITLWKELVFFGGLRIVFFWCYQCVKSMISSFACSNWYYSWFL